MTKKFKHRRLSWLWIDELPLGPNVMDIPARIEHIIEREYLANSILGEWAIECAERVLPVFEAARPDDKRPQQALEIVKRCLTDRDTVRPIDTKRTRIDLARAMNLFSTRPLAPACTQPPEWNAVSAITWAFDCVSRGHSEFILSVRESAHNAGKCAALAVLPPILADSERQWQLKRLIELGK